MTGYVVKKGNKYWPSNEMKKIAWVNDSKIYKEAEKNPVKFWEEKAKEGILWEKPWKKAYEEKVPYFTWFKGGELNFCVNALDRYLDKKKKPAIIWVPEPINESSIVWSYGELYEKVNKFANSLKDLGVKKGDAVSIYLPMVPEAAVAMLACTRIGAIHSVVFSAFAPDALKSRIDDCEAKILITSDGYFRRGAPEDLLEKAKKALPGTKISKVIVVERVDKKKKYTGQFVGFNDLLEQQKNSYCRPERMKSEDPMFILYTSGTTGKPKGILHDTGGYAVQSYWTTKLVFNLYPEDVMWCTADIGWITGHTYGIYGPLLNGATTLMYEGTPDFPDAGRWWKIIDDNKVNIFYTAPTAIRMFMKWGDQWPKKYKLNTLKILATVGEPIDEKAWNWYFAVIGKKKCPIIDTWWQTETGGTLINVLPGIGPFIPTVSGRSFPGTGHTILDEKGKKTDHGFLVQLSPFAPGMLHGVYKNHEKYVETYWKTFKGKYDTSDGAVNYEKDYIRITGRTDDVMKVAGHRLSTAELENALNKFQLINESAVVPIPDQIKGQVPVAFVELKQGQGSPDLEKQIKTHVDNTIGPTARPAKIYFVEDLPKTRSGKIMRRILKNILANEEPAGLMTLVNPDCVDQIKKIVAAEVQAKPATSAQPATSAPAKPEQKK